VYQKRCATVAPAVIQQIKTIYLIVAIHIQRREINLGSQSNAVGGEAPALEKPAGTKSREWLVNLGLTVPFLLLYWADLAHHTLFFDEVNAWAIAAASPTLDTLFRYVHFEGHPWLWYFLLWFPSRFTHDPLGMRWVVAPIGTAIYLAIGLLSPFTRLQKVLVFLSYFVIFEYTVMNRMYGPMFLLALLYVWRRTRKPDQLALNAALLGLMANTDMTGVLLSGALLLEYAYDRFQAYRVTGWGTQAKRRSIAAAVIYAAMLLFSIHSVLPSPEMSWQSSGHIGSSALSPRYMIRVVTNMIAAPWWPISPKFPRRFWETDYKTQHKLLLLAPIVLFAYWKVLRRDKNLLLLMGLTLLFGILFADIVYVGRVRHWGIAFISFLIALWMQQVKRKQAGDKNAASWSAWAYMLMGLSALSGIAATASSWTHPFSQARATAAWLKKNEPQNVALVGEPDVSFASLAEELERPVYFLECGCVDTFKLFSRHREDFPESQMPQRLVAAENNLKNQPLIFVFYRPLRPKEVQALAQESLNLEPVAQFTGADSLLESYYLYRITKTR
jgi:hypothetical protein